MILLRAAAIATTVSLSGVGAAMASTITTTDSYGVGGAPTSTDWSHVFTVDGFNPALGTLTGVTLTMDSNGSFGGTVTNTSPHPADFSLSEDIRLAGTSTNAGLAAVIGGLAQDIVVSESYAALASHAPANFGPFTAGATASTSPTDFASFESGPISATFSSTTTVSMLGGGGNIDNAVNTKAGATLKVVYTYTTLSADALPVPEPGSLMLMLSGLTGLTMMRRRRSPYPSK